MHQLMNIWGIPSFSQCPIPGHGNLAMGSQHTSSQWEASNTTGFSHLVNISIRLAARLIQKLEVTEIGPWIFRWEANIHDLGWLGQQVKIIPFGKIMSKYLYFVLLRSPVTKNNPGFTHKNGWPEWAFGKRRSGPGVVGRRCNDLGGPWAPIQDIGWFLGAFWQPHKRCKKKLDTCILPYQHGKFGNIYCIYIYKYRFNFRTHIILLSWLYKLCYIYIHIEWYSMIYIYIPNCIQIKMVWKLSFSPRCVRRLLGARADPQRRDELRRAGKAILTKHFFFWGF